MFTRDDSSPYIVHHLDPREVTWLLGIIWAHPMQPAVLGVCSPGIEFEFLQAQVYHHISINTRCCPWQLWGRELCFSRP